MSGKRELVDGIDRIEALESLVKTQWPTLACNDKLQEFCELVVEELRYLRDDAKQNQRLRQAILEALR